MKHCSSSSEPDDFLRSQLVEIIDMRHELVQLAGLSDRAFFEAQWAGFLPSHTGRSASSPRPVARLLSKTIEAGHRSGTCEAQSLKCVAVDTRVVEKNIAHPGDARLYKKARQHLVAMAMEAGLTLRQNYNRLASFKKLKGYTGPVLRDMRCQLDDIATGALRGRTQYPKDPRPYQEALALPDRRSGKHHPVPITHP